MNAVITRPNSTNTSAQSSAASTPTQQEAAQYVEKTNEGKEAARQFASSGQANPYHANSQSYAATLLLQKNADKWGLFKPGINLNDPRTWAKLPPDAQKALTVAFQGPNATFVKQRMPGAANANKQSDGQISKQDLIAYNNDVDKKLDNHTGHSQAPKSTAKPLVQSGPSSQSAQPHAPTGQPAKAPQATKAAAKSAPAPQPPSLLDSTNYVRGTDAGKKAAADFKTTKATKQNNQTSDSYAATLLLQDNYDRWKLGTTPGVNLQDPKTWGKLDPDAQKALKLAQPNLAQVSGAANTNRKPDGKISKQDLIAHNKYTNAALVTIGERGSPKDYLRSHPEPVKVSDRLGQVNGVEGYTVVHARAPGTGQSHGKTAAPGTGQASTEAKMPTLSEAQRWIQGLPEYTRAQNEFAGKNPKATPDAINSYAATLVMQNHPDWLPKDGLPKGLSVNKPETWPKNLDPKAVKLLLLVKQDPTAGGRAPVHISGAARDDRKADGQISAQDLAAHNTSIQKALAVKTADSTKSKTNTPDGTIEPNPASKLPTQLESRQYIATTLEGKAIIKNGYAHKLLALEYAAALHLKNNWDKFGLSQPGVNVLNSKTWGKLSPEAKKTLTVLFMGPHGGETTAVMSFMANYEKSKNPSGLIRKQDVIDYLVSYSGYFPAFQKPGPNREVPTAGDTGYAAWKKKYDTGTVAWQKGLAAAVDFVKKQNPSINSYPMGQQQALATREFAAKWLLDNWDKQKLPAAVSSDPANWSSYSPAVQKYLLVTYGLDTGADDPTNGVRYDLTKSNLQMYFDDKTALADENREYSVALGFVRNLMPTSDLPSTGVAQEKSIREAAAAYLVTYWGDLKMPKEGVINRDDINRTPWANLDPKAKACLIVLFNNPKVFNTIDSASTGSPDGLVTEADIRNYLMPPPKQAPTQTPQQLENARILDATSTSTTESTKWASITANTTEQKELARPYVAVKLIRDYWDPKDPNGLHKRVQLNDPSTWTGIPDNVKAALSYVYDAGLLRVLDRAGGDQPNLITKKDLDNFLKKADGDLAEANKLMITYKVQTPHIGGFGSPIVMVPDGPPKFKDADTNLGSQLAKQALIVRANYTLIAHTAEPGKDGYKYINSSILNNVAQTTVFGSALTSAARTLGTSGMISELDVFGVVAGVNKPDGLFGADNLDSFLKSSACENSENALEVLNEAALRECAGPPLTDKQKQNILKNPKSFTPQQRVRALVDLMQAGSAMESVGKDFWNKNLGGHGDYGLRHESLGAAIQKLASDPDVTNYLNINRPKALHMLVQSNPGLKATLENYKSQYESGKVLADCYAQKNSEGKNNTPIQALQRFMMVTGMLSSALNVPIDPKLAFSQPARDFFTNIMNDKVRTDYKNNIVDGTKLKSEYDSLVKEQLKPGTSSDRIGQIEVEKKSLLSKYMSDAATYRFVLGSDESAGDLIKINNNVGNAVIDSTQQLNARGALRQLATKAGEGNKIDKIVKMFVDKFPQVLKDKNTGAMLSKEALLKEVKHIYETANQTDTVEQLVNRTASPAAKLAVKLIFTAAAKADSESPPLDAVKSAEYIAFTAQSFDMLLDDGKAASRGTKGATIGEVMSVLGDGKGEIDKKKMMQILAELRKYHPELFITPTGKFMSDEELAADITALARAGFYGAYGGIKIADSWSKVTGGVSKISANGRMLALPLLEMILSGAVLTARGSNAAATKDGSAIANTVMTGLQFGGLALEAGVPMVGRAIAQMGHYYFNNIKGQPNNSFTNVLKEMDNIANAPRNPTDKVKFGNLARADKIAFYGKLMGGAGFMGSGIISIVEGARSLAKADTTLGRMTVASGAMGVLAGGAMLAEAGLIAMGASTGAIGVAGLVAGPIIFVAAVLGMVLIPMMIADAKEKKEKAEQEQRQQISDANADLDLYGI